MKELPDRDLCEQVLDANEINHAYYATETRLPGAVVYFTQLDHSTEFDLAVIYRVAPGAAVDTLSTIVRLFRDQGRRPRIRITTLSEPSDWEERLREAGFIETDEETAYLFLPEAVQPVINPEVVIERAVTPEDADRYSAVQAEGYDIPTEQRAWDRALARHHLAAGRHAFYLASLDGQAVCVARSCHLPGGVASLAALTTLPAARERGAGTSVIGRMADDARRAGCTTVFCTAQATSDAARYHRRVGWITLFSGRTYTTPE